MKNRNRNYFSCKATRCIPVSARHRALRLRSQAVGRPERRPRHPVAVHQPENQPDKKGRCQGGATDPSQVSAGWAYHLRELRTADGPGRHPGGARGLLRVPEPVSHATVHARRTEVLLVRTALRTVLTEENISRVLAEANDPQRYDAARERSLTRQDMQELGKTRSASSWQETGLQRAETSWAKSSPRYRSTPGEQSSATPSRCRETAPWQACAGRKSTCRGKY